MELMDRSNHAGKNPFNPDETKTERMITLGHDYLSAILKQLVILNAPDKEAQKEWYVINSNIIDLCNNIDFKEKKLKETKEELKRFMYEGEISKLEGELWDWRDKQDRLCTERGAIGAIGMFEGIPSVWHDNCGMGEEGEW